MRMPHALVTGGAGFIGSHLCEALVDRGWHVTCLDNLSTGCRYNISHLKGKRFSFIEGDVRDGAILEEITEGIDALFHLAAMVSVPMSMEHPILCHEQNVTPLLFILDIARRKGFSIAYASSSAVYGEGGAKPLKEDDPPAPQSPYGATKLIDEIYATMAHRAWKVRVVGLRLFNVYGPRQNPNGEYAAVIPRFIEALTLGKEVKIYGDGRQMRDFIFVRDVARAFIAAAERSHRLGGRVSNVASGVAVSINELYALISSIIGTTQTPTFEPPRPGDIKYSTADVKTMKAELGLGEVTPLAEGLEKMLVYFTERSSAFEERVELKGG
ncbi:MAG TPA: SDR family NAD(P)-dependent oxidoreductase [Synergistaceae bacterium]|nr:SDR family NAD(P)-dependent oxidoreductase [Synergistaceae bacterium]